MMAGLEPRPFKYLEVHIFGCLLYYKLLHYHSRSCYEKLMFFFIDRMYGAHQEDVTDMPVCGPPCRHLRSITLRILIILRTGGTKN